MNFISRGGIDGNVERSDGPSPQAPDRFMAVKKIAVIAAVVLAAVALIALGTYLASALAAKATASAGIAGGSHLIPAPVLIDGIWFYGRPIVL